MFYVLIKQMNKKNKKKCFSHGVNRVFSYKYYTGEIIWDY